MQIYIIEISLMKICSTLFLVHYLFYITLCKAFHTIETKTKTTIAELLTSKERKLPPETDSMMFPERSSSLQTISDCSVTGMMLILLELQLMTTSSEHKQGDVMGQMDWMSSPIEMHRSRGKIDRM